MDMNFFGGLFGTSDQSKQKCEKKKSQKQMLWEQLSMMNSQFSLMNQGLQKFMEKTQENDQKLQVVANQTSILQTQNIPTEEDITRTVNQAIEDHEKSKAYDVWFTQLSEDVKADLVWIEKYLNIDKYKAKDFYLEFIRRINTRAQRVMEVSREPVFESLDDKGVK